MYEMSQRHPVWVTENHVNPCNSVASSDDWRESLALCKCSAVRHLTCSHLQISPWSFVQPIDRYSTYAIYIYRYCPNPFEAMALSMFYLQEETVGYQHKNIYSNFFLLLLITKNAFALQSCL